jgi:hypothetical protein
MARMVIVGRVRSSRDARLLFRVANSFSNLAHSSQSGAATVRSRALVLAVVAETMPAYGLVDAGRGAAEDRPLPVTVLASLRNRAAGGLGADPKLFGADRGARGPASGSTGVKVGR